MASRWFRLLCSLVVSFGWRTSAALAASRSLLVVRFPRSSPSAPRLIAVVMASRWFRLLCSLVDSAVVASGFEAYRRCDGIAVVPVALFVGCEPVCRGLQRLWRRRVRCWWFAFRGHITTGPEAYRRCDGIAVVTAVLFVGCEPWAADSSGFGGVAFVVGGSLSAVTSPPAPRLIAAVMASRWLRLFCSLVVSLGRRISAALAASRSLLVVRCFWAGFVRVYLGRRPDWRLGVGYREVVGACCGRAAPTAAQLAVWDARRRCLGHLRDDQRFAQIFRRVRRPLGGHRRAGSRAAACGLWSWSGFG